MKKKKVNVICLVIIGILALAILSAIGAIFLRRAGIINFNFSNEDSKDGYDIEIEVLNTTVPTTILLYGEDLEFREAVPYKKISEINEDTLTTETEYTALIISDCNATASISTEEYQLIREKLENNKFSFYYYGRDKLSNLARNKILSLNGVQKEDLCFGSAVYMGDRISWTLYAEEDKAIAEKYNITERPASFIISNLVMCYKSNN